MDWFLKQSATNAYLAATQTQRLGEVVLQLRADALHLAHPQRLVARGQNLSSHHTPVQLAVLLRDLGSLIQFNSV